jgi:DNA polymerase epsilon subunit 1
MVDGQGFLVINRPWFSKDIDSFEYWPLEHYCTFTVWNCGSESDMLEKWFSHIQEIQRDILVPFTRSFPRSRSYWL